MNIYRLDITRDHCPMTFVKTKLELEKLAAGDQLEVLLNEGEPLENVPRAAEEQGFKVLKIEAAQGTIHRVLIQK